MTPTQIRRARGDAYQIAQAWSKNGMKDGDGNPVRPQDLLKDMINAGQIPFDIAVRALSKFYAPAKKWYDPKKKTSKNVSNVTAITNAPGWEPDKGVVQLPTNFSGTHVSDGLGWGTKTAHDFMAPAGAPVNSPVSGTILYFHPEGAQGGGSMLIRGDDGYEYWLGHIEGGLPGGRITAGQEIARIAHQNVSAPHVHIDRRPLAASA
jgi:Peptidase family M23.